MDENMREQAQDAVSPQLAAMIEARRLRVDQCRSYERTLPADNHAAKEFEFTGVGASWENRA